MKTLILIVLIPVLLLIALRAGATPWHLLSASEYDDFQTQIKTLQSQVEQLKTQVQKPQISNGAWMRDKKPTTLDAPDAGGRR